jgi:Tfp pilus assembly protein FimV
MVVAPPAGADIGETIIQRCTHAQSLSGFSQAAYRRALQELSADSEEYSDCGQLIRQAQAAAASGKGGGSTGGGSSAAPVAAVAATPAEQHSIAHAATTPSGPVSLDGQTIHPGVIHAGVTSAFSSLPVPLLALLLLLLAGLLLVLAGNVRDRVRDRRSD